MRGWRKKDERLHISPGIRISVSVGKRGWARYAPADQHDALTAELQAARTRETAWLREKSDLLQRQDMLTQEFEHRLVNGLQIIVSLLSLALALRPPRN
jgi:two-component sensor histidine kinase